MFTAVESSTGHFSLRPIPQSFFGSPPPVFGGGALLVLNRFVNNSAALLPGHLKGIQVAAAQARLTFPPGSGALEVFGITDRTGSETVNKNLSDRRAAAALQALAAAMGLAAFNAQFSNGLGERFADEYFQQRDNSRDDAFRGVTCYLWDSLDTARDPFLRIEVAFAAPPEGGGPLRRMFLGALHMGRHRVEPLSPFR